LTRWTDADPGWNSSCVPVHEDRQVGVDVQGDLLSSLALNAVDRRPGDDLLR
jgi:hypothetical protein